MLPHFQQLSLRSALPFPAARPWADCNFAAPKVVICMPDDAPWSPPFFQFLPPPSWLPPGAIRLSPHYATTHYIKLVFVSAVLLIIAASQYHIDLCHTEYNTARLLVCHWLAGGSGAWVIY